MSTYNRAAHPRLLAKTEKREGGEEMGSPTEPSLSLAQLSSFLPS